MELEIAMLPLRETLQSLIEVQEPAADSVIASTEFQARCQLVTPNWNHQKLKRVFVDGFVGKCYSNSWKVYTDALEQSLTLWAGYALARGKWWEHAWCMIEDQIVESTYHFDTYFGCQLTKTECDIVGHRYGVTIPPVTASNVRVYTSENGIRRAVPYRAEVHAAGIGREKDPVTGAIRDGLGRYG